ncbi:aerobic respiration control sensor protein arcB [Lojkania enalia]|uniref:Aerobic respiration control sensor protein arcB n=1 Tax=Lojkania enalia TaxID=147567 RepID=A0A9P4K3K3_9PLEO|nr:aerobic respiration control sensor protein arcB [Didymosphaeria enalia]
MAGSTPELSPRLASSLKERTKSPKDHLDQQSLLELDSLSLREILDQDSRPTLILDLDSDYLDYGDDKDGIKPIFCNAALRLHDRLLDSVTGSIVEDTVQSSGTTTYGDFRSWATGVSKFDDSKDVFPLTLLYRDMLWTGSTIRQRWRIISGNQCYNVTHLPTGTLSKGSPDEQGTVKRQKSTKAGPTSTSLRRLGEKAADVAPTIESSTLVSSTKPKAPKEHSSKSGDNSHETSSSGVSVTLSSPEFGCPDWTIAEPKGVLSEHMVFTRSVDWSATPLGPMVDWSVEFREVANLVMRNPHPAALFWGEELTMFYNEAYKNEVAGNKHPGLMGTGFSGPFSELWDGVAPIFRECARTGKSVRKENDPLPIHRYGYLEETFFSWSFVPVYGGTDRILGFYNGPFETTYQTISTRRLQTLRHLGERLAEARSVKHFWACVLEGLVENHNDVPFALLYSITDSDDADTASHSSDSTISLKSCVLEGSIGIPDGHPASPPRLDLKRSKEGFIPAFREAMRTREPTTLHARDGSLPEDLLEGIEWRGFGDPCKEAIIIPVRPTNGENIFAFLLIGINPRRAYDEDYKAFTTMLNRQLATSLASFLLFEDEVRKSRSAAEAAALQREQLSQQLELQASRMRRMTEFSPLGMYLFSPDGVLLEANERYYEMVGQERDDPREFGFLDHIADESRPVAKAIWDSMVKDFKARSEELQIKNPKVVPRDLEDEPIEYWVLASSQPEIGMDGKLRSIMGSIADISHIKWVQGLQERRLREAEETKRRQNEFIDITSHEMRNPLSAILICADDIRDSLTHHKFSDSDAKVIDDCIEAANNIALCVQHQKAIVDDILTVSKLDSNLLLIAPVPVQPVNVIQRAVSMFKPEVQAKDIDFTFCPHDSFQELGVDWVNLDPSRLLQITVNLITNAIKFTQNSEIRKIAVHIGVSAEQPELHSKNFEYVPTRGSLINITAGNEWGDGQLLYIRVKVEDTGCGLTLQEKQKLFERFAQASPRTHAQYGGSGLGLFISRQLAELHGGQIGVSSEAGVGSTFGFFIQARRVAAPRGTLTVSRQPSDENTSSASASTFPQNRTTALPIALSGLANLSAPNISPINPENYSHLHILIVEDNLVNQRVLAKQLTKAGCSVYTANNGFYCISHLSTTTFHDPSGTPLSIILMDLEMPEMDGLTCVGKIREMEQKGELNGRVPVIAVTANVRDEQVKMALGSGMDDVVRKPFQVRELLERIQSVLDRLRV